MHGEQSWAIKTSHKNTFPAQCANMMQVFVVCLYRISCGPTADRDVILTSHNSHFATFCFTPLELWPLAHKKSLDNLQLVQLCMSGFFACFLAVFGVLKKTKNLLVNLETKFLNIFYFFSLVYFKIECQFLKNRTDFYFFFFKFFVLKCQGFIKDI